MTPQHPDQVAASIRRMQAISMDVNEDMPDADDVDNYREYTRRVNDPNYTPRNTL